MSNSIDAAAAAAAPGAAVTAAISYPSTQPSSSSGSSSLSYQCKAIERRMIQFVSPMSLSGATPSRGRQQALYYRARCFDSSSRIRFDLILLACLPDCAWALHENIICPNLAAVYPALFRFRLDYADSD